MGVGPLAAAQVEVEWGWSCQPFLACEMGAQRTPLRTGRGVEGGEAAVRGEAAARDACVDRMWGPRGPSVRLGIPSFGLRGALSEVPQPLLVSGPGAGSEV